MAEWLSGKRTVGPGPPESPTAGPGMDPPPPAKHARTYTTKHPQPGPSRIQDSSYEMRMESPEEVEEEGLGDYPDYLHCLLADYGIQLSPGGSRIVMIEEEEPSETPPYLDERPQDLSLKVPPSKVKTELSRGHESQPSSPFSVIRPTPAHTVSSASDVGSTKQEFLRLGSSSSSLPDTTDVLNIITTTTSSSGIASSSASTSTTGSAKGRASRRLKKPKLYQIEVPMGDDSAERRRLNAINAKKHRDLKKRRIQELEEEVQRLTHINRQCKKALWRANSDVQKLRREVTEVKDDNDRKKTYIKQKEIQFCEQREKLALFQGHLDLISSSLDDDNPAKRLLSSLIKQITPKS